MNTGHLADNAIVRQSSPARDTEGTTDFVKPHREAPGQAAAEMEAKERRWGGGGGSMPSLRLARSREEVGREKKEDRMREERGKNAGGSWVHQGW